MFQKSLKIFFLNNGPFCLYIKCTDIRDTASVQGVHCAVFSEKNVYLEAKCFITLQDGGEGPFLQVISLTGASGRQAD